MTRNVLEKKHYRLDCLALESNFLLHKPVKVRQTPLSIPVILENMLYNPGWKWQCCPYQWFWRSYCTCETVHTSDFGEQVLAIAVHTNDFEENV